jgi:hypothetical protein
MSRLADSFKEERMSDEPVPSCLATDLLAQAQNAIEAELPSDRVHFKEAAKSDRVSKLPKRFQGQQRIDFLLAHYTKRVLEDISRTCEPALSHYQVVRADEARYYHVLLLQPEIRAVTLEASLHEPTQVTRLQQMRLLMAYFKTC